MCSQFQLQNTMDNTNFQGDLADIFLGGGANTTPTTTTTSGESSDWQFPTANPINYPSGIEQDFGDPFCNLRDPLFHDLDMMPPSSSLLSSNEGISSSSSNKSMIFRPKSLQDQEEMNKQPTGSIFSRMLQISPTIPCNSAMAPSTVGGGGSLLVSNKAIMSPNTSKTLLVENSGLQISSPRNTGIKRRKSQAKKVVCIPAAAPANNRQGGEVVPSDLWAWRKYGQKPIKGSPYPRGYYRCSSSKGCSARKQVERSRTDPNMLVITYTCEHNHPWPTQRNALAGSTRSHPLSKNTIPKDNIIKSKEAEQNTASVINIAKVKEEVAEQGMHIDDSYQPAAALPPDSHEDFFADLAELEADPLNLLFARTFSGDDHKNAFSLYDWSTNKDGSSSTSNK